MNKPLEISASELVLSAIFFLQQKNGVTAAEITKFICDKRKCKPGQVKGQVKRALDRAIKNGIFSRKRGLYRIEHGVGEKLNAFKGKMKRHSNAKRKGKFKISKESSLKKIAIKPSEAEGGTNSFKAKVFQDGVTPEKNFPFKKFKTEATGGDDHGNGGEGGAKNDTQSPEGIKGDVAMDSEEYEDDDFLEDDDDDDDIDYFADEYTPHSDPSCSAAGSVNKYPALDKNDTSDSEGENRDDDKQKADGPINTSVKRKHKRTSDGSNDEGRRNDFGEAKKTRPKTGRKKRNRTTRKTKRRERDNRRLYGRYGSENNSGDSENDSHESPDKKESDFSNEDTDSENISVDDNQSDQENPRGLKKSGNAKEGKSEEFIQNFQEGYQQKKPEKQNTLSKDDVSNNSKGTGEPSLDSDKTNDSDKINDSDKTTVSETIPNAPRNSPVPENIPPADECYSRSYQRKNTKKLLRRAKKRLARKEKGTSERKSTKRSRHE